MYISLDKILQFENYLQKEEKSRETIEKYMREVRAFQKQLDKSEIKKEDIIEYKNKLIGDGFHPSTINAKLSALNGLFKFLQHPEYCVKFLKIQRKVFQSENKELTKKEYDKLVEVAYEQKKEQLALILQTIGSTGIRVSEQIGRAHV